MTGIKVSLTAVYDGTEMIVHKSRCEHRVSEMTYPAIRERLHLSGTSRAEAVSRAWKASLSADWRSDCASRTRFASCAAGLGA